MVNKRLKYVIFGVIAVLLVVGVWGVASSLVDRSVSSADIVAGIRGDVKKEAPGGDVENSSIKDIEEVEGVKEEYTISTAVESMKPNVFVFSSIDSFISSYNSLVNDLGNRVVKEVVYSDSSRCMLEIHSIGNIHIEVYEITGDIKDIIVKGVEKENVKAMEGYVNGKAKINYTGGNIVIYDINYNSN